MLQFLVEAVALSVFGGLVGVTLGVVGTWIMTTQLGMPFVVSTQMVLAAFGVSAAFGVVFGYLPAQKAARLDPIAALRHE